MLSSRRGFLGAVLGGAPLAAQPHSALDVRQNGARGDGRSLDTAALQRAIDACAQAGGGTVLFPPGVYLSGTLLLRGGVTLHLAPGSVLRGSARLSEYPPRVPAWRSYTDNYTDKSLIYAEQAERVAIEGAGVIDGQGAAFEGPYKQRPYLLRFIECRGVNVSGVRIVDSPMWVQHYLACEDVRLNGLIVRSRANHNNDGIDIDSCRRVRISDCDISSGDDAVCLKATSARPCSDVAITNCVISSHCNAIKLGTESNGGFDNIAISNCTLYDTRLAGLALEMVDGGTLSRVVVSNLAMRNVQGPIFVRLADRGRPWRAGDPKPAVGKLHSVLIQGVEAEGAGVIGSSITGLPWAPLSGIALRDIRIRCQGGGTPEDAGRQVPEWADRYPEYSMFQTLPAYGLYCRHVRDLRLENLRFSSESDERRPALLCDDLDGLDLNGLQAWTHGDTEAALRLRNVRNALIRGCRHQPGARLFAQLEGPGTAGVVFQANQIAGGAELYRASAEVPAGAFLPGPCK